MLDRHRTVLIVDDDHDIVRGAVLRLHAAGYETRTAYDGQQALQLAEDEHPDGIVLDVRMPRVDGLKVLAQLHQQDCTRDIPVVMLSASLSDRQRALDAGARFFLQKPYTGATLVEALDAALAPCGA
jgi:CheY-like chemotaxis protein